MYKNRNERKCVEGSKLPQKQFKKIHWTRRTWVSTPRGSPRAQRRERSGVTRNTPATRENIGTKQRPSSPRRKGSGAGHDVPGQEGHRLRREQRVATPDRQQDLPRSPGESAFHTWPDGPSPSEAASGFLFGAPAADSAGEEVGRGLVFRSGIWARATQRLWKNRRPRGPRHPTAGSARRRQPRLRPPLRGRHLPPSSRRNPFGPSGFGAGRPLARPLRW